MIFPFLKDFFRQRNIYIRIFVDAHLEPIEYNYQKITSINGRGISDFLNLDIYFPVLIFPIILKYSYSLGEDSESIIFINCFKIWKDEKSRTPLPFRERKYNF
jgi:hypothetical protein